ncbi:hypothetical protein OS493_000923 [Desmophyllum pertusum]|uniref:Uncharacterized protein n=1 Tax=Desmophyllum pertusum TaxID=174260 RepID=A0A9W9ZUV2_9CNID|nr:hypothetical protein OS493_000923 [Desmophyllum pertusum]
MCRFHCRQRFGNSVELPAHHWTQASTGMCSQRICVAADQKISPRTKSFIDFLVKILLVLTRELKPAKNFSYNTKPRNLYVASSFGLCTALLRQREFPRDGFNGSPEFDAVKDAMNCIVLDSRSETNLARFEAAHQELLELRSRVSELEAGIGVQLKNGSVSRDVFCTTPLPSHNQRSIESDLTDENAESEIDPLHAQSTRSSCQHRFDAVTEDNSTHNVTLKLEEARALFEKMTESGDNLSNIMNGVNADSTVDADAARMELQKPALADALWAKLSPEAKTQPQGVVQYVLDGSTLLHRVPWPRGSQPTRKCATCIALMSLRNMEEKSWCLTDATPLPTCMELGKATALKKFVDVLYFREQANVFSSNSVVGDVVTTGEKALVSLAVSRETHNKDVSYTATEFPTAAAARYHSLRVYLQVKQWQGEDEEMSIEDWGWKVSGNQVRPVNNCTTCTTIPSAVDQMQLFVRLQHYEMHLPEE